MWDYVLGFFFGTYLNVETFNLKPSFQIRRCGFISHVCNCSAAHTILPSSLSPRDLTCLLVFTASCTLADFQPEFPGLIQGFLEGEREAVVRDFLTLTRSRSQQVRAANHCNTGREGALSTRNSKKINIRTNSNRK